MTHEIHPLIPVPKLTDERMKELLEKYLTKPNKPISRNTRNPESYILLEAKQHGNYSYPDLLVSMHRLGLTQEVEKAANKLGLILTNTAQEQDGHQYIGNINHEHAINLVKASGLIPVNLRLFVDFLKEVKYCLDGEKKVYDGNKNIIPYDRLLTAWNEITKVREPWRSEWFDNRFVKENDKWYTIYYKINPNGILELAKEPLEDCLMKNKLPGIDLEDWLERANSQGLPPKDVKSGSLHCWYPKNDHVARFGAFSVWAFLFCCGDPQFSGSGLGIRAAKIN